jgi:hypothetical protein
MHAPSVTLLAWVWFVLTGASVVYGAWDLFANARATTMTKWAWLLVILYTGPFALAAYFLSGRLRAERGSAAIGSTIHCLAGDATGILLSAAITRALRLPMGIDAFFEYVAGFSVGLFVFQALFMRHAHGGGYARALQRSWFMEWVSMNAVMAGMIPVMIVLMTMDERAMDPASICFWGVMSVGTIAGALFAFPINAWWERPASGARRPAIAFVTVVMLAVGTAVAATFGDLSMR